MKIGILTSSYPRFDGDGAGTFIRSLSEAYIKLGHHVAVIAPDDSAVISTSSAISLHRFRYAPARFSIMGHGRSLYADTSLKKLVPLLLPTFTICGLRMLTDQCAKQRFDWIHAHWIIPMGVLATLGRTYGTPRFMVTLHGSDIFLAERLRFLRGMIRVTLMQAEYVCAVSSDLSVRCSGLSRTRRPIQIIPNGVDVARFRPQATYNDIVRQRLQITNQHRVILAIGRLVHKKGFDVLLRALPEIVRTFPKTVLLMAGEGDLETDLRKLAEHYGISDVVRWLGHVPWHEVAMYYCTSDVCVFPAVRDENGNVDGLPASLLEAMACAAAIVATNIGGISEVLQHNANGLLIEPGNAEQLTEAIIDLLLHKSKAREFGLHARQTVIKQYTWENIAGRYIMLAHELGLQSPGT